MTQILVRNGIDSKQMNVLLGLFNSWNVDVEITENETDNDLADMIEAKGYADDEDTSLADFKKYVNELAK